jgi:hypothetical protein
MPCQMLCSCPARSMHHVAGLGIAVPHGQPCAGR